MSNPWFTGLGYFYPPIKNNALATKTHSTLQTKSNLSIYSLYHAEECNELAKPISASLRPGNTASFEQMSQWWPAVGNTVFNLTGLRFEPQTSRSRDECVTARQLAGSFCTSITEKSRQRKLITIIMGQPR